MRSFRYGPKIDKRKVEEHPPNAPPTYVCPRCQSGLLYKDGEDIACVTCGNRMYRIMGFKPVTNPR